MAYELFEGRKARLVGGLVLSVAGSGLYFGRELADLCAKNKWKYVLLYYDRSERKVGLWMFANAPKGKEAGRAYNLAHTAEGLIRVTAQSFYRNYGLRVPERKGDVYEVAPNKTMSKAGDFFEFTLRNGFEEHDQPGA